MFFWSKYPLLRILASFLTGGLFAFYLRNVFFISFGLGLIITIVGIVVYFLFHYFISYKNRIYTGVVIIVLMVWMGFFMTYVFINTNKIPSFILSSKQSVMFIGDITESPVVKKNSIKTIIHVIQYKDSTGLKPTDFKMILYLKKDKKAEEVQHGDRLVFNVRAQTIQPPKNPEEFNYKRYLGIKKIHLQGYATTNVWEKIDENKGNVFLIFASNLRAKLLKIWEKGNLEKDENAVASAILLGADDKLDADLNRKYASAGVSHILCVSGMHVGIVFMIVNYLLFFLSKNRQQKTIKTIILLLTVWFYAAMTGMAPSVMRASTMFTFVALGNLFRRQTNTYNSLLSSLFFLSCINPLILFDVSMQLSYSAVFGIVWLQRPIKNMYFPKTKLGNYVWEIVAVSLVAQLLTAPFAMYYFHQFPTYFLLANIIIITFTPFVVGASMLSLLISFWEWGYEYISILLNYLIKSMNYVVAFIEKMPYSTVQKINFTAWETLILYLVILFFASAFLYKKKSFFYIALIFIVSLFAKSTYEKIYTLQQKEIIAYSIPNGFLINCIEGNCAYMIGDGITLNDKNKLAFHVENYHIKRQIKHTKVVTDDLQENNFLKIGNFIQFSGINIFIINQKIYYEENKKEKLKVDYLIIDNNPSVKIKNILKMIDFDYIVFSSNNSKHKIKKWIKECDFMNVKYKNLSENYLRISL